MSWNHRSRLLTLWTGEGAGFRSLLQSTVELAGELSIGDASDVVVGLHVFLDGLTAVGNITISPNVRSSQALPARALAELGNDDGGIWK